MKTRILSTARLSFPLASAIAALLAVQAALAISYNWTGNTGDPWNVGASWSGTTVPLSTDDLTILGPVNTAGVLNIDFNADNPAGSLIFTNTAATTITNTLSGADKTLTLGSGGFTTGTGAVTLGSVTANQAVNMVLSAAQTWNIGSGGFTATSLISGIGTGITKTGSGNLVFNSALPSTFTGGLNSSRGTLTLNFNNLVTPTNLIDPANALSLGASTLTITGKNIAAATTIQTFAGTTFGAGSNTINIAKGASATSATLNLGNLTADVGAATIIIPTTPWDFGVVSTTEIINVSSITGKTLPLATGTANWINVNAGLFYSGNVARAAGSARWANVDNLGQLAPMPASLGQQSTSGTVTLARVISTADITLGGNADSYGLVVNSDNAARTLNLGTNNYTYTINGILGVGTNKAIISAGTGGTIVIGSERNLVLNMDNTGGVDVNAPIVDNAGGASSVTIASTAPSGTTPGTVTLGSNNTFTGPLSVSNSRLSIGSINDASTPGVLGNNASPVIFGGSAGQTATLAYTGAASSSTRPFTLTTGGFGTFDLAADLTLSGPFNGGGGLNKTGPGGLTLSNNNYSGATTINQGALKLNSDHTGGALTFGSTAGSTATGNLDLFGASATFSGALVVRSDSATSNTITIGSGKTLLITGAATVGFNSAANSTTNLTATGLGTLSIGTSVTPTNANMVLGGATGDLISNNTTLDMSGLATFYANLGTGVFRAGSSATSFNPSSSSTVTLAGNSTIIATSIILASRDGGGGSKQQTLKLGNGTNVINTTDIFLAGRGGGDGRANGRLIFNDPTLGSLTLRGLAGGSTRANLSISFNSFGSASPGFGLFDSKGHMADLRLETLIVAKRNGQGNQPQVQGQFDFNMGTLDVNNLEVGFHQSSSDSGSSVTGNVNLSGGTSTFNNSSGPIRLGVKNTTNGSFGTGKLNVSGSAAVTVAAFGGTSILLGEALATGTATGEVNLTGGTLTVAGDISRGAITGTSVATILISGGTLNMGGNDIGTLTEPVAITAESGTLSNVATINGTGGLTKTTVGTLTVSGTNAYTGTTTISDGTLALGADNALPANPVSIGTATLNASTFDDSLGTLDVTGSAVINLGAGANLVFANSSGLTWTGPNLNITGTFVSGSSLNFGIGGLSVGQLALISVNGLGTGTYTLNGAGFLIAPAGGSNYASWANDPLKGNIPGEPATGDFDKDGITNIVEYALGKNPRVSSQPAGVLAGNVITYTKGADAIANGDVSWVIETSQTLVGAWLPQVTQAPSDPALTISYTLTPSTPTKNFARLKVTQTTP